MTLEQTVDILSKISAFYGQPKSGTKEMAAAWYLIMCDYEYNDAVMAVVEYAREDKREYSSFPTIGSIIQTIEKVKLLPNKIFYKIRNNMPYEDLSPLEKRIISQKAYEKALTMGEIEKVDNFEKIKNHIKEMQNKSVSMIANYTHKQIGNE